MNFNFKKHGDININEILNILPNLDWESYKYRQLNYFPHRHTKTIPLIWDEDKSKIQYWPHYINNDIFKNILIELETIFTNNIGDGKIVSAILVKMIKNTSIDRHTDAHSFFKKNNRIHIPIVTNEKCIFEVDGEEINMKIGEIWEIDNFNKEHSVVNNGDLDRIHLIVDWEPMKIKKVLTSLI